MYFFRQVDMRGKKLYCNYCSLIEGTTWNYRAGERGGQPHLRRGARAPGGPGRAPEVGKKERKKRKKKKNKGGEKKKGKKRREKKRRKKEGKKRRKKKKKRRKKKKRKKRKEKRKDRKKKENGEKGIREKC